MGTVKLGMIGCGICARDIQFPAIARLPEMFTIVNVCGRDAKKTQDFAALCGAARYSLSPEELLSDPEVEAVSLTYPYKMNYELAKAAAQGGRHILMEKPLAENMRQARQILELEKERGPVMMVAENYRFRKSTIRLRKLLDAGAVGRPRYFAYSSFTHVPETLKYISESTWRRNTEYGMALDRGIHCVAALRCLFGETVEVKAVGASIRPIGGLDDTAITLRFKNGVCGVLQNCSTCEGMSEETLLIFGKSGSIKADIAEGRITVQRRGNTLVETVQEPDRGYTEEFRHFYKLITGEETENRSSLAEAYRDLGVLLGAIGNCREV